jgi:hypothetical protein
MMCAPYVRGGVAASREFHKISKTLSRPCAQGISNRSGFLCVTNMQNASELGRWMRQERIHRTGLPDRGTPSTRENSMRYVALTLAVIAAATTARAQDAIPDLKGIWSGKGKIAVFGSNVHHPGTQTMAEPPRMRDIEMRHR